MIMRFLQQNHILSHLPDHDETRFQKLRVKMPFSRVRESRACHPSLTSTNKALDKQDVFGGRGEHPHATLQRIQYISFGLLNYMFIFLQGKKGTSVAMPLYLISIVNPQFQQMPKSRQRKQKAGS